MSSRQRGCLLGNVLLRLKLLEHWCGAAGEKNVLRSTGMLISLESATAPPICGMQKIDEKGRT